MDCTLFRLCPLSSALHLVHALSMIPRKIGGGMRFSLPGVTYISTTAAVISCSLCILLHSVVCGAQLAFMLLHLLPYRFSLH
eukprot:jgi/Chrzof1/3379/Cz12g23080.t1